QRLSASVRCSARSPECLCSEWSWGMGSIIAGLPRPRKADERQNLASPQQIVSPAPVNNKVNWNFTRTSVWRITEQTTNITEGRDMSEAIFRGESGRLHRFTAHRPDHAFSEQAAVYCFARPGAGGRGWVPLFLSRTANLTKRLAGHEQW